MSINLERRLGRLETASALRKLFVIWQDFDQTPEEATAARFPDGVPEGSEVMFVGWEGAAS